MEIIFAPKGILQINDARIIYRNFEGRATDYNREGDRNFSVVIPDRDLTKIEVDSILDNYRGSELLEEDDGPILMYKGEELITLADALNAFGWNVKVKPPRDQDDSPFMHLKVKVKFNDRGPFVGLESGVARRVLDKGTVHRLDKIDIASVDMDLRPYDYDVLGKQGRSAYLQSINVVQEVNRFEHRYASEEYPEE